MTTDRISVDIPEMMIVVWCLKLNKSPIPTANIHTVKIITLDTCLLAEMEVRLRIGK